jgi:hypothetical protein
MRFRSRQMACRVRRISVTPAICSRLTAIFLRDAMTWGPFPA